MRYLLEQAGKSFLRAFGGSLLILLPGVLAAPNLNAAYGLGVAALISTLAAGLKAIQVFVPKLSVAGLIGHVYAPIADSFIRAFLGTLITLSVGLLNSPDLSFSKSALVALLVGAVTAGIRAVQGFLTKGDAPAPQTGLNPAPVSSPGR